MIRVLLKYRRTFIVSVHLALVVLSNYAAFWLRFDGPIPEQNFEPFVRGLPLLVAVRGLAFVPFRLYQGIWRYTGIWDLRNILGAVLASTSVFYVLAHWVFGLTAYPRSVFIIDALLLILFLGGIRLVRRVYQQMGHLDREKRVLVYGAGDAGEMIVRDMKNNAFYDYEPIGFVDDDPSKVGQRIHGVRVLGTRAALADIMRREKPHEVLVALPRAEPATIRGVVQALEPYKVPIKTLPNLRDLLNGRVSVSTIRSLAIEDLLTRAPVGLDPAPLRALLSGKRVLVTGAGGSIGAELSRQIAGLAPRSLVLFERHENGLYAVDAELCGRHPGLDVRALVGDVTDAGRVARVLTDQRPEIVFHAAAHKHVPLMESNPAEAVKNNVVGTRIMAEAAARYEVDRFILISSDKAVKPASVMGATKRVAELIIQAMAGGTTTSFIAVRFGNVLGSSGSVVPRFIEQLKAGGPLTVTHPEMRRYFMLIPEAVQLVLHAAALGQDGATYVLEMGEQMSILEMARNIIRFSGYVPDTEIPITFTGLRPGEKLSEELVADDEIVEPSPVAKILRVGSRPPPDRDSLLVRLSALEAVAMDDDAKGVIRQLQEIVPSFRIAAEA